MGKKFVVGFLSIALLVCCLNFAFALDKTDTGFYYPIGTKSFDHGGGSWLGRDKENGGSYFKGKYHIGVDMLTPDTSANAYAVTNGEIFYTHISDDWGITNGANNCALFIRHKTSDGRIFTGLYGHLSYDSIPTDPHVYAGQVIGKTGDYPTGIHLHFGIRMGDSLTPSPWGMMPNSEWTEASTETNGFVDPVAFIENNYPLLAGYFSDGKWHTDGTSQAFADCYEEFKDKIGYPFDNGRRG